MSSPSTDIFRRLTALLGCAAALWLNSARDSSGDDATGAAGPPPQVAQERPTAGAVDVPAGLTEIVVVFDQDMLPGYSWMSGPGFPETTGNPVWRDKRTCALPVRLERGRFYRVGINSSEQRFQNFMNEDAVPAPPRVIWFVTEGASDAEKARAVVPRVVSTFPANGDRDVAPGAVDIEVTFDRPMSGGMSWTGYGPEFPMGTAPAYWKDDRRTCVFPARLEPGREYLFGINSVSYINFQSADGVPAEPVVVRFSTRGAK